MGLRNRLEKLYFALEQRIAPGLRSSQDAYKDVLDRHVGAGVRWLDLGCGSAVLPAWHGAWEKQLVARCKRVVGLDRSLSSLRSHATISLRACGDIARLPFPDNSFDLVTANMVVEHLDDPFGQFLEIQRILAPAGVFLCHTPNALGYPTILARLFPETIKTVLVRWLEGREPAAVFRTYYRANSRWQLRRLADASELRTVALTMTMSSAELALVAPLAVLELFWIRALMWPRLEALRPTIIATFKKAVASV